MNLPPDKVRLLRSYDNEKKWELICDQVSIVKKTTTNKQTLFYSHCKNKQQMWDMKIAKEE